jgi:hypothetical protein
MTGGGRAMRHWRSGIVTFVFALVLGAVLGAVSPHKDISTVLNSVEISDLAN